MRNNKIEQLRKRLEEWDNLDAQGAAITRAIDVLFNATGHDVKSIEILPDAGTVVTLPPIGMTVKELGEVLIELYRKRRDAIVKEMEQLEC